MGLALFWYYISSVVTGLHILTICVLVPSLVAGITAFIDTSVNGENHTKLIKNSIIVFVISASILVFVPRYTFFYALAGYEASKHIATTELGTKVQDLIIKKLEDSTNGKK